MGHEPHYRTLIENLAAHRVGQQSSSNNPQHFPELLAEMFASANAEIRIFNHDLDGSEFDHPGVLDAAADFVIRPNAKLRILLGRKKNAAWAESHPLLSRLRRASRTGQVRSVVEVRNATGPYAAASTRAFAIMGNQGFRCLREPDGGTAVIANFHGKGPVRVFASAFDKAFEMAGKERRLLAL